MYDVVGKLNSPKGLLIVSAILLFAAIALDTLK